MRQKEIEERLGFVAELQSVLTPMMSCLKTLVKESVKETIANTDVTELQSVLSPIKPCLKTILKESVNEIVANTDVVELQSALSSIKPCLKTLLKECVSEIMAEYKLDMVETAKEYIFQRKAYTYEEAGHCINVSSSTISKLVKDGKLKFIQIGGKRLILASELNKFIEDYGK